ncbi:MAG: LPS export ABC transporter permease LptG [Candidatus Omnitrophota bacterium]|nr:LPS export ABC transporter permease LptG [Candidatus Omnitrophota bacterium]
MRILDKYIAKYFILPFLYCLLTFIILYIIIDLFGHLDEILRQDIRVSILLEYYLAMIPLIILQTAPVASLISTIYVLGALNKSGEITAMRAAGISIQRILMPFIYIGLSITILVFAISEKVLPGSMRKADSIKQNYIESGDKDKLSNKKAINNIALYGKNNRLIFIDSFDPATGIAMGITILQQDKKDSVTLKINAHEGKWLENKWLFSNILMYRLGDKGEVTGAPQFLQEKTMEMENPKDLISKGTDYEYMSFNDLSHYIKNFSETSPKLIARLRVNLHQKISLPFTSLVVILIGAGFALRVRQRGKAGALLGIGMSIVIGFIYYAFMASCIALGKSGFLNPIISAHFANILFGFIGIALIRN